MPSQLLPPRSHPAGRRERAVVAMLVIVLVAHAAVIAHRRTTHSGDFDVSREFGRRLVAGEPLYTGGLHYPYMPAAALFFAPLALLPAPLAFALRYVAALGGLWFVLRRLYGLLAARDRAPASRRFVLAALTLVLASHYILRDLDDGGPHLILLAFLVAGIAAVARGREVAAAGWFGLAVALKAPNALVLPFLMWKRQWRLAGLTALSIALWSALPLLWMGPASWGQHQSQWFATTMASAAGRASGGEKESEDRPQNQALRATVGRLCAMTAGGHAGPPLPAARATLEPACSHAGVPPLVALALLAAGARWSRRRWRGPDDPAWLPEASAVLILSLLLSPVTWVQHLVLLIPALYLIAARTDWRSVMGGAAIGLYLLLSIGLNRELLGRERYLVLLAYGLHTWCMLLVLGLLVGSAREHPETAR